MCLAEALLESVSLSVGPLNVVTRPRLWLKTTSEKGPHLSCVVFTRPINYSGQRSLCVSFCLVPPTVTFKGPR